MIFRVRHLTGFLRKHGRISNGAQARSSSTNLREINRRKRGREFRLVVTLDPNKFTEKKQQPFHIGDLKRFCPYIARHEQSSPVKGPSLHYDLTGRKTGKGPDGMGWSYPPDTKAFLYYSTSPKKPRIAGELRLRVVSSDDPASFESGSDLLEVNGRLWSRPLCILPNHFLSLYEKLREERLVPDDLDASLSTFHLLNLRSALFLYTLNDTFIIDFRRPGLIFNVITEQGMESIKFFGAFIDCREDRQKYPYTGSALARFERSTLLAHEGTRTVVLRFLKIITPVKCVIPLYDNYLQPPQEGELYRRRFRINTGTLVWGENLDESRKKRMTRGLQMLW